MVDFEVDGRANGLEDVLHRVHHLRTDAVPGDHRALYPPLPLRDGRRVQVSLTVTFLEIVRVQIVDYDKYRGSFLNPLGCVKRTK